MLISDRDEGLHFQRSTLPDREIGRRDSIEVTAMLTISLHQQRGRALGG